MICLVDVADMIVAYPRFRGGKDLGRDVGMDGTVERQGEVIIFVETLNQPEQRLLVGEVPDTIFIIVLGEALREGSMSQAGTGQQADDK